MAEASEFPEDPEARRALLGVMFSEAIPHNAALGLRLLEVGPRTATVVLPWAPHLVGNPDTGVLAGGVVTTLIDATCGAAAISAAGRWVPMATLDLRIDYLRTSRPGEDLVAHAEVVRVARTVTFVRALAHHGDPEHPVASAQGTFILTAEE